MKNITYLTTLLAVFFTALSAVASPSGGIFSGLALPRLFAGTAETESAARFEPSSEKIVREMLDLAEVTDDDLVFDLGSGDGRIVIAAARERGARAVGVEIDPDLIKESRQRAIREHVSHLVQFRQEDLFKTDLGNATVVMLYLSPDANSKLRPLLLERLKPGTRIVSHSHDMDEWKHDKMTEVEDHTVYLWTVPADVSGQWKLDVIDKYAGGENILQFKQTFQQIEASLRTSQIDIPVTGCSLHGRTIRFTIDKEIGSLAAPMTFSGNVEGNRISGKLESKNGSKTWTAERVQ